MTPASSAEPTKRRISRLALTLLVLALLVGGAAFVRVGLSAFGSLTQPSFAIPGATSVPIDDVGTYAVFEETGTRSQNGPMTVTRNSFATLRPGDVTVTDPSGARVRVMPVAGHETLKRDGLIYTASVEFRADTAGTYRVDVQSDTGSTAVVARELANQFASLAPWLITVGVAGLVFVGALIAVVVSAIRAARANRRPPPGAPPFPSPGPYAAAPYPPSPYAAAPYPPGPAGAGPYAEGPRPPAAFGGGPFPPGPPPPGPSGTAPFPAGPGPSAPGAPDAG